MNMISKNQTPRDLAQAVASELRKRHILSPKLEVLITLFESMYFASLMTEESQPISFHVVYLDPDNPDPNPPPSIANDRWIFVRLDDPIPITISNLIKIAKASDPRTSSFAIYHDSTGHLFVWGLVDQGNSYNDFVNYETESGFMRPGIFQASIAGVGHLVAYIELDKIAELKVNTLVTNVIDVLGGGPIYNKFSSGLSASFENVKQALPEHIKKSPNWDEGIVYNWIVSLCRLLLRVQKYRHGGAVLISPDVSLSGLNVKYKLKYERLRSSLEKRAVLQAEESYISTNIWGKYVDKDAVEIPLDLYFDESINEGNLEDNRRELDGTIWFISLLSRVDGLVLMNPSLEVQGFGVEITVSDEPSNIFQASNRSATKSKLRKIDYNHFGTRHRSMMRYCSQVPDSIGFVISQDGDVRAMTQVHGHLVLWENIKLQLHDFIHRKKQKTKII